jgi:hypothetical protein
VTENSIRLPELREADEVFQQKLEGTRQAGQMSFNREIVEKARSVPEIDEVSPRGKGTKFLKLLIYLEVTVKLTYNEHG